MWRLRRTWIFPPYTLSCLYNAYETFINYHDTMWCGEWEEKKAYIFRPEFFFSPQVFSYLDCLNLQIQKPDNSRGVELFIHGSENCNSQSQDARDCSREFIYCSARLGYYLAGGYLILCLLFAKLYKKCLINHNTMSFLVFSPSQPYILCV